MVVVKPSPRLTEESLFCCCVAFYEVSETEKERERGEVCVRKVKIEQGTVKQE